MKRLLCVLIFIFGTMHAGEDYTKDSALLVRTMEIVYDQLHRQQCNEEVEYGCGYSYEAYAYKYSKQFSAGLRYFLCEENKKLLKEALSIKFEDRAKLKKSCDFFISEIQKGKNSDLSWYNYFCCCLPSCAMELDDDIRVQINRHIKSKIDPFLQFKSFIEFCENSTSQK
jgi:hypothetical protein